MAGFWKAPRALVHLLAQRALTPNEYMLLHVIAEWGADRPEGFDTTNGLLAGALRVDERTIRRALVSLRAQGFIAYDDHERVPVFTIRTAERLRTLVRTPETPPLSAPLSAASADTAPAPTSRKAASAKRSKAQPSADPSRARAETDTETERKPKTPSGGSALARAAAATNSNEVAEAGRTPGQRLVAHYVDELRAIRSPTPRDLVGKTAKFIGRLVDDGIEPATIARAIDLLIQRRLDPSVLPSLIPEAAAGPATPRNEHPADRLIRGLHERGAT